MARKGWDQLSPGYRARLERNGITKGRYERGESIQAARGHSQTPERPSQAGSNFPAYTAQRDKLIRVVTTKKQMFFGTSPKWNPLRAQRAFRDNPPPIAKLKFWASLDKEEWLDAIREDREVAAYLGYH